MNMRAEFPLPGGPALADRPEEPDKPGRGVSVRRMFRGGEIDDRLRLPRYIGMFLCALVAIWGCVGAYLHLAPVRFSSDVALILPGAGSANSVNLANIGQASSHATSPYASSAVSPTVTYQRLLGSGRILAAAAELAGETPKDFGKPRVRLVDQTSLILFEMKADSPELAQRRSDALTLALLSELDQLRLDELRRRDFGARAAIEQYRRDVATIRTRITELQRTSGLNSTDQYANLVADTERLATREAELQAAHSLMKAAAETLRTALDLTPKAAALTLKLQSDPEFIALGAAMSNASARLAEARGDLGENHPTLIAARDDYQGARTQFYARASEVAGLRQENLAKTVDLSATGERASLLADFVKAVADRNGLEAELRIVTGDLTAARSRVRALVETAAELDDLHRDYQIAEAVFASAIARNDTEKSDTFASYPLVQVLEPASLPEKPSSPHTIIAIGAGVAGSLCLLMALFLAWLRKPVIDRLVHALAAGPETSSCPR